MDPMRLTDTGEMLIIPGRPGLTDESNLPIDGFLGQHNCWKGEARGKVNFHEGASGWIVFCTGCSLRIEVPESVRTYGELREFLAKEFGG